MASGRGRHHSKLQSQCRFMGHLLEIDFRHRDGILIFKCKAHCSEADVASGKTTRFLKIGNDHADHFAVVARKCAEDHSPTEVTRCVFSEAVNFYKYLLYVNKHWDNDTEYQKPVTVSHFPLSDDVVSTTRLFGRNFNLHPINFHAWESRYDCCVCTTCGKRLGGGRVP